MNQRQMALAIVGAILVGLLLAAVIVGLLIGAAVRSVASGEGPVQVRTEQPASVAELEDAYALDTGSLEGNLGDLNLPEGTTEVGASVETGALTVVVPDGASVRATADADTGSVVIFGRNVSGEDIDQDFEEGGYDGAARRLDLDLSVGTGVIEVQRGG